MARYRVAARLTAVAAAGAAILALAGVGSPASAASHMPDATASPFTAITVSTTPSYGGADATYTIGFTTPADGVLGGFTLHAPDGTVLPSDVSDYSVTDGTTSYAVQQAAVGTSGSTENLLMQTGNYLPASTALTMTIDHVTNPSGCDCVLYLNADNGSGDAASPHYTILGGYPAAVLSDHPVRYYRLGESGGATSATDLSDSGVDGTYQPAATLGTSGALPTDADTAATTDGSGPVATATDSGLPMGTSARTVEGWVRLAKGDTGNAVLADYGTSGGYGQSVEIDVVGNGNQIDQNFDYSALGWSTPYSLADGQWHLIDWVVDGAGHDTVYLDGVSLGTKDDGGTNTNQAGANGLRIGSGFDTSGAADVDEVAIYPTALSQARVRAHLAASVQGPNPPTDLTAQGGANSVTASWTGSAVDATHAAPLSYRVRVVDDHGTVVADTTRSRDSLCQSDACTVTLAAIPAGEYVVSVAGRDGHWQGPAASAATGTVTGATDVDRYAASVLADQPGVYYRLDEQPGAARAQDSSGNDVDGYYTAGTLGQPGALPDDGDQAAHADGSGPVLTASDGTLPMGSAARTVEGWIRLPEGGTGNAVIVDYGTSGGPGQSVEVGVVANGNVINQNWDYSGLNWSTPYNLEDGHWHLVDWVDDGAGNDTVYLDGVSLGTKADGGTNTQPAGVRGLRVGDGFDTHGVADVDEVAIYPTALSAARVRAHLAASVQGPNAPTDLTAQGGVNRVTASWTAAAVDATHEAPSSYRMVVRGSGGVVEDTTRAAGDLCTDSSCTLTVRALPAGSYTVTVAGRYDDRQGPGSSTDATVSGADDSSAYAQGVLRDGPSVYYRLDEPTGSAVAEDSSGNGVDGRYQGPAQLGVAAPGSFQGDTAAGTDGTGPIATATDAGLPAGSAARTVEGWIRLPEGGTGNAVIVDYGTSGGPGQSVEVGVVANGNVINQNWDYSGLNWSTPYNLEDGHWHLVDWVDDGAGNDTVYLDGVSLGTKADGGTNTQPAGVRGLRIGDGFDTHGPADLDEVAIYPTALSSDSVAHHYSLGTQTISTSHEQTIAFTAPSGLAYGAAPTALGATASSGLPVSYASGTPSVCEVDASGTLHVLAAGSCSVTASQAGDADYDPAPDVTRTFDISQAPLRITASDETMTAGDIPPTPTPSYDGFVDGDTADSLATKPTCVSNVDARTTTCSGAVDGSYDITYVAGTLTVNPAAKQDQTIAFATPAAVMYGGIEPLGATASSGLPVSYASDDHAVCTVDSGGTLTATGAGTCVVTASQPGDDAYNPAPSVQQTVHVDRTALTISASDATMTDGGPLPTVTPSYSGFVAGDGPSSLTTAPTCVAVPSEQKTRCSGAEDPNYQISYVDGTLTIVAKKAQTVSVTRLPTLSYARSAVPLRATATSGLHVFTFAATPAAVCTVTGSHTLKINGAGLCRVRATQPGDATYAAASDTRRVTIDKVRLEVDASNAIIVPSASQLPQVGAYYDGFVRGDTVGVLGHQADCSIVRTTVRRHHHVKHKLVTQCDGVRARNYAPAYVDGAVGTSGTGYAFLDPPVDYLQSGSAVTPGGFPIDVVRASGKPRPRVVVDPNAAGKDKYALPPGLHYVRKHGSIVGLRGRPTTPGSYLIWLRATEQGQYASDQVIRIDVY